MPVSVVGKATVKKSFDFSLWEISSILHIIGYYSFQILRIEKKSERIRSNNDFCDFVSYKSQENCLNGHCLSQFFDNRVPWLGHVKRIQNDVGV